MTANWISFTPFEMSPNDALSSRWKMALDLFDGVNHVHLKATSGKWTILRDIDLECGPDGLGRLPLADSALMLAGAPAGCLLGRFGGSSAGAMPASGDEQAAAANAAFMIGAECLVKLPDGVRGPLYIAFNIADRPVTIKEALKLELRGITL